MLSKGFPSRLGLVACLLVVAFGCGRVGFPSISFSQPAVDVEAYDFVEITASISIVE
jgi:hypothetical protein